MTHNPSAWTPREAAYRALLAYYRENIFIKETLQEWRHSASPPSRDDRLAQEIAAGVCRMALLLDHYIGQLPFNHPPRFKRKERLLLQMALYQYLLMERIPVHALVNETVHLAKIDCHSSFAGLLNAILRQLPAVRFTLPDTLSARYSYPDVFVEQLIKDYGEMTAISCLEAMNKPPVLMARHRPSGTMVAAADNFDELSRSSDYYIQNSTPVKLTGFLASLTPVPFSMLDLCASPGGKLIAAHDRYPSAQLFANDVSETKLNTIRHNLDKYGISAILSCGPGEEYPARKQFDLIILDVPCSNSGVLNKRPEARWRQNIGHWEEISTLQKRLLAHASTLLAPQGHLWYLTCSILKEENEEQSRWAERTLGLESLGNMTILPDTNGADGGFAVCLKRN